MFTKGEFQFGMAVYAAQEIAAALIIADVEAMSSTEYWGPALLQFVLQRFADCFFLSEESHTNFKADLALHEASSFCGRRRSSDMGKCFVNETNAAGESRQDVILQLQVWQELRYFPAQEITFV